MKNFHDDLYETFFLSQGSDGLIETIRLDEATGRIFAQRHGEGELLPLLNRVLNDWQFRAPVKWYLDGPDFGGERRYVVLALFIVCQAQWHIDEADVSHNIRTKLSELFGLQTSLNGLPALWQRLRSELRRDGVQLEIPAVPPSKKLVGIHQALVFPLFVHRRRIRQVIQVLPEGERTDAALAARFRGLSGVPRIMRRQMREWERLLLTMDPDAYETPFWRTVQEERLRLSTRSKLIVRMTDDFPAQRALYERTTTGEEAKIATPDDMNAPTAVVAKGRRTGRIPLSDHGFGLFEEASVDRSAEIFLKRIPRGDVDHPFAPSVGNGEWRLAEGISTRQPKGVDNRPSPLERKEGIRAGRRFLFRHPFGPWFRARTNETIRFTFGNTGLDEEEDYEGFVRPVADHLEGDLKIEIAALREVVCHVVPFARRAERHPVGRLRTFDSNMERHDDGDLANTAPKTAAPIMLPPVGGQSTDPAVLSLGEALYARSARGIGLGEAFELAQKVEHKNTSRCWSLLRAFVDAGWFDPIWRKGVPAQALLPRQPSLLTRGADMFVDGMVCEETIEGLRAVTARLGGSVRTFHGELTTAPPCHLVVGITPDRRSELAALTDMQITDPSFEDPSVPADLAREMDMSLYDRPKPQFGVWRLEKTALNGPPYWSADSLGKTVHVSRTAALLHAAEMAKQTIFDWRDGYLWSVGTGRHLPSSWARWLRYRTLQGGGAVSKNSYANPCDRDAAVAISLISPVIGGVARKDPAWLFHAGRAGKRRMIGVGGRVRKIR